MYVRCTLQPKTAVETAKAVERAMMADPNTCPLSAPKKKYQKQNRKHLASRSHRYEHAGRDTPSSKISPAGSNDEQQQKSR